MLVCVACVIYIYLRSDAGYIEAELQTYVLLPSNRQTYSPNNR
jgi:hypothetical protein